MTETDLSLVEALQVSPRASWSSVGTAIGISPVTAARRWARLEDAGIAWVTGPPGVAVWNAQCVAYVEITCTPGRRLAVAELIASDRHALSVELTAGGADLFVTVAAADLAALSRYLLGRLDMIPGITGLRTRIATRIYRDGSGWRLGALPRQAASDLRSRSRLEEPNGASVSTPLPPADRAILVRLGLDGRSSYRALAAAAEISEATARRRTARLLRTGMVLLRAEVAGLLAGWPVLVNLSVDVPTGRLEEAARMASQLREVRLCATLAGTPPLVVAAWLRDPEEIHRFELSLAKALPGLTIVDRCVTLRPLKRMGRLLDEAGRAVAAVPMDVWADPLREP
ncbi:Lrp/AsnC family transcriptional regulator [Pseudonocardia acaciae]|uniref:Lrp/AsnC family transcriptional regulator n=1 Tax=Pseudonocardia acaciae TaxID=551276 RepID=UPI000687230C|nr:Lrp/AsnC family transcriptional regulator [Pseudonocardia acaciae]